MGGKIHETTMKKRSTATLFGGPAHGEVISPGDLTEVYIWDEGNRFGKYVRRIGHPEIFDFYRYGWKTELQGEE